MAVLISNAGMRLGRLLQVSCPHITPELQLKLLDSINKGVFEEDHKDLAYCLVARSRGALLNTQQLICGSEPPAIHF